MSNSNSAPAYNTQVEEVIDKETGEVSQVETAFMGSSYKDSQKGSAQGVSPQIATEAEPPAAERKDPFTVASVEKTSNPQELPVSVPKSKPVDEKDPKEVVFDESGAVKHDGLKPRVDLIPPEVIFAMGSMFRHGAEKYDDHNWEKGMKWSRIFGSTIRHLWAWWGGEDIDPESKQPHLYSAACCIAMLIAYRERKAGTDDRFFISGPSAGNRQINSTNKD